jgi:hypothetical protein
MGPLSTELAAGAWSDLEARLAGQLAAGIPPRLGRAVGAWAGDVVARLPVLGHSLEIRVPGERVEGLVRNRVEVSGTPRDRIELAPLWEAISGEVLAVGVRLAPFELEVGALLALRTGDILCTGHGMRQPLQIHAHGAAEQGEPVGAGLIGQQGGFRAVAIVQASTSNEPAAAVAPAKS